MIDVADTRSGSAARWRPDLRSPKGAHGLRKSLRRTGRSRSREIPIETRRRERRNSCLPARSRRHAEIRSPLRRTTSSTGARFPTAGFIDIGPKTVELFAKEITPGAKMIVWNGSAAGVFELEPFNAGTFAIAKAVAANSGATSIVGGGESVAAVKKLPGDKITTSARAAGASLRVHREQAFRRGVKRAGKVQHYRRRPAGRSKIGRSTGGRRVRGTRLAGE